MSSSQGILLVDKPASKSSFYLVNVLRRITGIKKIGHSGTLDPFATGVMVMLVGKDYTRRSQEFTGHDKAYTTTLFLGKSTDSYDIEGQITATSDLVPTFEQIQEALTHFQGTIEQVPPMFSAKKHKGKRLYELARKGETVERPPVHVNVMVELVEYTYPHLKLAIHCSKGTYIRSIGHDLGERLGCHAHLETLTRTKSGPFSLNECVTVDQLMDQDFNYTQHLQRG